MYSAIEIRFLLLPIYAARSVSSRAFVVRLILMVMCGCVFAMCHFFSALAGGYQISVQ